MLARLLPAIAALSLATGLARAGSLTRGDLEMDFGFAYTHVDFGKARGVDLGSYSEVELGVRAGWALTQATIVGVLATYSERDFESPGLGIDIESRGRSFGGYYQYVFPTVGKGNPYLGASLQVLGGDLGKNYDFSLGVEIGYKFYFLQNTGLQAGIRVPWLFSDGGDIPDANGVSIGLSLLSRF